MPQPVRLPRRSPAQPGSVRRTPAQPGSAPLARGEALPRHRAETGVVDVQASDAPAQVGPVGLRVQVHPAGEAAHPVGQAEQQQLDAVAVGAAGGRHGDRLVPALLPVFRLQRHAVGAAAALGDAAGQPLGQGGTGRRRPVARRAEQGEPHRDRAARDVGRQHVRLGHRQPAGVSAVLAHQRRQRRGAPPRVEAAAGGGLGAAHQGAAPGAADPLDQVGRLLQQAPPAANHDDFGPLPQPRQRRQRARRPRRCQPGQRGRHRLFGRHGGHGGLVSALAEVCRHGSTGTRHPRQPAAGASGSAGCDNGAGRRCLARGATPTCNKHSPSPNGSALPVGRPERSDARRTASPPRTGPGAAVPAAGIRNSIRRGVGGDACFRRHPPPDGHPR